MYVCKVPPNMDRISVQFNYFKVQLFFFSLTSLSLFQMSLVFVLLPAVNFVYIRWHLIENLGADDL
jgi:hypothetical protein